MVVRSDVCVHDLQEGALFPGQFEHGPARQDRTSAGDVGADRVPGQVRADAGARVQRAGGLPPTELVQVRQRQERGLLLGRGHPPGGQPAALRPPAAADGQGSDGRTVFRPR